MTFAYYLNADGYELFHECSYHTTETVDAHTIRRTYPRFHGANSLLDLKLVADEDTENGVYAVKLVIENLGKESVRVRRADVGLSVQSPSMKIHFFRSDWGSEFSPEEKDVTAPFSYGSIAGRSCKGYAPYAECETEDGVCTMALAWSGNWNFSAVPVDGAGTGKIFTCAMGLTDEAFYHDIQGGETFETPCLYISSAKSREEACFGLRRYYRARLSLLKGEPFDKLPVVYNTWWGYEDKEINEEVYAQNAKIAKDIGCDYAMLDAGWFGDSVDGQTWYEKRGDWENVNSRLFPSGLKAMCDNAKVMEIAPGIWCEIEAVGKDAKLNLTRDDIIAKRDGKSLGYVCLGSEAGRKWAMGIVDRILGEYGAKWIKFDFNLDPGWGCNRTDHDHGAGDGLYAHYMGYYQMLDEIRAKYPDAVIENCSSGGLRNDIGMLSHTHYGFLADPDHTEFHLQLFWGALSYLHQSSLYHFSWSDTTYCDHNLNVRFPITESTPVHKVDYMIRAAMMGVPGLSYRLPDLPGFAVERMKELVAFYKSYSTDFILHGDAYRLTEQPLTHGRGERIPAFEFVSRDGRAMVFFFRLPGAGENGKAILKGLEPERTYTVRYEDSGKVFEATGEELMTEGVCAVGLPEEGSEVVSIF